MNVNYSKDGELIANKDAAVIMIEAEEDLQTSEIDDVCIPGSMAYTAGFEHVWQKDVDGNWVSIV